MPPVCAVNVFASAAVFSSPFCARCDSSLKATPCILCFFFCAGMCPYRFLLSFLSSRVEAIAYGTAFSVFLFFLVFFLTLFSLPLRAVERAVRQVRTEKLNIDERPPPPVTRSVGVLV